MVTRTVVFVHVCACLSSYLSASTFHLFLYKLVFVTSALTGGTVMIEALVTMVDALLIFADVWLTGPSPVTQSRGVFSLLLVSDPSRTCGCVCVVWFLV